jgi:preprotein translocase subunit SecG
MKLALLLVPFFNVVYVVLAIVMIGLILMQRGAGAQAGSSFGAGASGTVFGAQGSANFLSRSTAVCAALFFIISFGMGVYLSHSNKIKATGAEPASIMDKVNLPAEKPQVKAGEVPLAAVPVGNAPPATTPVVTAPVPAVTSPAVATPVPVPVAETPAAATTPTPASTSTPTETPAPAPNQ